MRVVPIDNAEREGIAGLPVRVPSSDNQPPTASLSAEPTSGLSPLVVNFDASASTDPDGQIVLYEWDFSRDGDFDESGDSATTSHTYTKGKAEPYTATVRVKDDYGLTDTASVSIIVTSGEPFISLASSETYGYAPLMVAFDASGNSDPDGRDLRKFEWDWNGDGTFDFEAGSYPWATHMYAQGSYITVLRVTDDEGDTSTKSIAITAVNLVPDTYTFNVEWSPDVTLVEGENLVLLWDQDISDPENYMFLFDGQGVDNAGLDFSPGRILVIEGLALRRITSVDTAGSGIIVSTEYATLNEAILNGTISWDYDVEFTPEKIASFIVNGKELSANDNVIHFEMEFGDYKYLVDISLNGDTAPFKFVVEKKVLQALRASFQIECELSKFNDADHIELSGGQLADFDHAINGLHGNATLKLVAAGSGNDAINFEFPATVMKIPFMVGPIPVVLNVKIQFVMNCIVHPEASALLTIDFTYDSDIGFSCDGVHVLPGEGGRSQSFDKNGDQNTAAARAMQVSFGVGFPRVELGLFRESIVPWAQIAYVIGGGFSTMLLCKNVEGGFIMNAG